MLRECVVLVSVCVFGVGSLTGRGFFCRDPETGKLHPANSTWTASSFCGKYHCKLKRKNITRFEYAPQRQINITTFQLLGENITMVDIKKENIFVKKDEVVTNIVRTSNKTEPANKNKDTLKENQGIKLDDKNAPDKDRYLTAKEIKRLTEILHTVKKGDLDALLEIYNLAQDIYKELDKTSKNHLLQEALSTTQPLDKQIIKSNLFKKVTKHNHASYWYEPLASGKVRVADLVRPDIIRTDMNPEIPVMAIGMPPAASKVNVVPKPMRSTLLPPVLPSLPPWGKLSDTFFSGPLSYKDFRKLPYYYPISNFQRMSSYKHEQKKKLTENARTPAPTPAMITATTPAPVPAPVLAPVWAPVPAPVLAPVPAPVLAPVPAPVLALVPAPVTVRASAYKLVTIKLLHNAGKYQNDVKPSIFLPYPFTNIQHYNWSHPQNLYHEQLFDKFDVRKTDDSNNQNTIKRRVDKQDNAVLMNPDLENFQDLHIRASMKEEDAMEMNIKQEERRRLVERRRPDWQTDSLPQQILDEVRAHIQEKQRLFINPISLRKKVKLERVAKLLNLDQIIRTKRSEDDNRAADGEPLKPELYEVYIERTTCLPRYDA